MPKGVYPRQFQGEYICHYCKSDKTALHSRDKHPVWFYVRDENSKVIGVMCSSCYYKSIFPKRYVYKGGRRGFRKKHSEESKKKMSEAKKGKRPWNFGKLGVSAETSKKHRIARSKQEIPKRNSKIEIIIRNELTKLGIEFERQRNFLIRGSFHPVDFFIKPNIIIECDGEYHHTLLLNDKSPKNRTRYIPIHRDFIIDYELEKAGYKIIRLWGEDIKKNLLWCMKVIQSKLGNRMA